nr:nucleotide-binding alpha-beta plait domain-containing protein [Tanacetum cinerariifolium]
MNSTSGPYFSFLFLIVVKALQVTILEACDKRLYKGVFLAENGSNLSLIQYTDDTLLLREWSRGNSLNLIHILKCFELALDLKVNISKSKVIGVGVHCNEVESLASSFGCLHDPLLFTYLGSQLGKGNWSWRLNPRGRACGYHEALVDLISKTYVSSNGPYKWVWTCDSSDNMSRDVITVGSIMRIPLLYRGDYSQWRERFMNYLEEQMDGEAMINSIHNEKKTRKTDRLAISLLIQGLPNDIYSLIDSNETAKDLWDALERQMRGFEYGEQDRKATILYEYETFKAIEEEQLLDTYLRYLQVINDLKKCGYKKDNCELNYKFLNNLQPEWKQYGTLMRQTKNLMDINIDALYNILKQNQEFVKSDDKKEDKKADEKKRDMSKFKCYNCKKEGHFAKDSKKAKVKDYNYYKTKMLLAKKDSDEQVLLAEDQAWMESSSDCNQEINANMAFMAQIEKVLPQQWFLHLLKKPLLRKKIDEQEILFEKMSRKLVEMNNNVLRLQEKILEKETKISELKWCISNKDVEIEKGLERLNECENKLHKIGQTNQTIHMIM